MRKNEYRGLSDFLSEYTGKRDPANNKWYELELKYKNIYYRLVPFRTRKLSSFTPKILGWRRPGKIGNAGIVHS